MGYIKKLKSNELVGGTDKTTIYPVTSTEAVFEEITNGNESSFKSQKTINKEQQDELNDHEERIQAAEAEDIKSITINGSTKEFRVDDRNNVDLTIYTVDNDPEMPSIASNVEDLRNMVGTSTPVLETSHKTRIETLEGGESVTGSVENKIKTKVDSINSSYQDDNNEYVKYSMTQTSGEVTNFNIDETNLKNAIASLNTSISGTNIIIVPQNQNLPSTGNAGTIYRKINAGNTYTDYMYSNGWKELATHDTSNEQAQVAYYTCAATGSGAQATKQFVGNGSLTYTPSSGGHIKILMGEANTATGTIYLQFGTTTSTKKPLYYNGESVSSDNTWEAGETIAVYYDPSANNNTGAYFATNALGGGGKAEKIKYDNSQSGLAADNVQGALDEVAEGNAVEEQITLPSPKTYGITNAGAWNMSPSFSHYQIPITPERKYKVVASASVYTRVWLCTGASTPAPGGSIPLCSGTSVIAIDAGNTAYIDAPTTANYMYVDGGNNSPQSISEISSLKESIAELDNKIEEVAEEVTVFGDNLIDMSTMGADTTGTTYLTATKDTENNGVVFNVVSHNNSSPFGRIYQMHLVAGKTYRLSFEYINTAYQTAPVFRNSSNTYIHSDISYITMSINTEYKAFTCMFVAPDNVYYLAFANLTNGAAGGSLTIRNFSLVEVSALKDKISEIDDEIEQLNEDIDNIENIKAEAIDISYQASQAVRTDAGHEGELVNRTGCGHSSYIPTKGAKKIYVLAPALGTSNAGIAFYCREAQTSCCGAVGFAHFTGAQESLWQMYDVPEGANFFRMTLYTDTPSQYKIVIPSDYLMELFKQSCQSMIGTQIMRSAVPISDKKYTYAFGAPQYPIIGHKAYVSYGANENTVDGDHVGYPNDSCLAIVDLFDMSHEVVYPISGTKQKADGTPANNAVIGYITSCATPQGSIASFGLMRFNDKNPYYCYSIMNVESISSLEPVDGKIHPINNWTTCRLSYNGNTVDFTINNYRQMLVDMGYASSYIASTTDAVDNINLHYDKTEGIYYAVLCGSVASSQVLPIVLMQSTDMATWSPKAYLGIKDTANEIEAIYKNGVVYVVYRTANAGMKYIVYNTSNITVLSSGIFPTSKDMLSKPDVFTFDNEVYMAINVDPSIYGELLAYNNYSLDARQEIAIYKVVNGVPKLFRRVNNPTGIDYFAFTETPPMYATNSSANPMYAQGAIYIAFSEDKRHLYRRQIAQVSFADVTALFADFGRI